MPSCRTQRGSPCLREAFIEPRSRCRYRLYSQSFEDLRNVGDIRRYPCLLMGHNHEGIIQFENGNVFWMPSATTNPDENPLRNINNKQYTHIYGGDQISDKNWKILGIQTTCQGVSKERYTCITPQDDTHAPYWRRQPRT
jgi:hypothetical protein